MTALSFVVVTGNYRRCSKEKYTIFLPVSTTCYDDPIRDHSGPALIKYMAEKSNDTYVKEDFSSFENMINL
jgi:hypothetical protein